MSNEYTSDHVTPEFPRAYEAACKVDPFLLASALDHIARTASKSRSQTRRNRWIEQRALIALQGREYRDCDLELPKDWGPNSAEKLQRRMAYHIAIKHQLLDALRVAAAALDARCAFGDADLCKAAIAAAEQQSPSPSTAGDTP